MKTLVIHPADASTDMLKGVYADTDWTIVNTEISRNSLNRLIREHDRIIMMGHGSADGLYGYDKFVINHQSVFHLRGKKLICVWCYADDFVRSNQLTAICTGMIISEWSEADYLGVYPNNDDDIDISNDLLAKAIKACIDADEPKTVYHEIYKGEGNPIIEYNKPNFYDYKVLK